MADTKLSLIYNFADMRHRTNSFDASYKMTMGSNSYIVKKIERMQEQNNKFENQIDEMPKQKQPLPDENLVQNLQENHHVH